MVRRQQGGGSSWSTVDLLHGTFADFHAFDPQKGSTGLIFFSTSPRMANGYAAGITDRSGDLAAGSKLIPVYLRIMKPYDYRAADNKSIAYQFYQVYGGISDDDARQIRIALYGSPDIEDEDNPEINGEFLRIEDFITALNQGEYPALELFDFLEFLRGRGYDGIVTHEVKAINFGVFDGKQVKSAFAKEFNPDSDHLSEMKNP